MCQILDVTEKELDSDFLTPNTRHINTFKIKPRALHVIGGNAQLLVRDGTIVCIMAEYIKFLFLPFQRH